MENKQQFNHNPIFTDKQPMNGRLLSLDILRGITVAGMILVNNGYGDSFSALVHSKWNGLTPCDLVFPFFLFIMGASMYFSFSKQGFKANRSLTFKIIRRFLILFSIGLFINWFELALKGKPLDFGYVRIYGVMQRIALSYLFVSALVLFVNHKWLIHIAVVLLLGYGAILWLGNGYAEDASNVIARIDNWLFGATHLYKKSPVDPEGLLSTVPSVAHVLIGFSFGKLVKRLVSFPDKTKYLLLLGTVLMAMGLLVSIVLPLNKRVWSPSYVLVTCGLAAILWGILVWLVDWKKLTRLTPFFLAFGVNPLVIYVLSELLAITLGHVGVSQFVYNAIHSCVTHLQFASLFYALYFVLLNYLFAFLLYKRRIIIKL